MPYKFTLFLILFNSIFLISQPRLEIAPNEIEFEDIFHRNKNVSFINKGDAPLRIDSLVYKNYYYFARFNRPWNYPVFLQPNDSVKMDCILESYVVVPSTDTSDTLIIYNNGNKPQEKLKIKIKYYDDDYGKGYFNGHITDGTNPIDRAKVYFFYENNYIIKSVVTDQDGYYYADVPPGNYAIAVEKDSYYVSFYQNHYDPFTADLILLKRDSLKTIDFQIDKMLPTGNSISGTVMDSISLDRLKKGILIVRTGTHTPTKVSAEMAASIASNGIYTAFIKPDGTYKVDNVITPTYYYVQGFSDYYIPSYFNYENKPAVFWQQADSILISGSLSNVNLMMERDSSVGGGRINGNVTVNSESSNLSDVVVLAHSTDNNLWYNYGFLKDSNEFKITNLPYGNYKLFAQKIGFNDGVSMDLQITPAATVINGVNIPIIISAIQDDNLKPTEFKLEQNYPNPFNPTTKIRYAIPALTPSLSQRERVILRVYDILGNEVATLVNEVKPAGYYEVEWDASRFASGMFICRLTAGKYNAIIKMILLH